jgi:TetR/AcrR family transcriptional regulator, repressor for divergent bdcA
MTTKIGRPRGRPRRFDAAEAVSTAQRLFHVRGYDAVSIAAVTDTLGINPPSFYAAYGSKAAFYEQVLAQYSRESGVPLDTLLRADRPVADCLAAVLLDAAQRYAADPEARGCMVLEGVGCDDPDARCAAAKLQQAAEAAIHQFVSQRHPAHADRVTDLVSTTMAGLSARARQGVSAERLTAVAMLAAEAIAQALVEPAKGNVSARDQGRSGARAGARVKAAK